MGPTKPAKPIENGIPALELAKVEFLPDEDVLDEEPEAGPASHVGFAGPSEAPPSHLAASNGVRGHGEAGSELRISQVERRDSIRYFVVLVAVLAAIVASVFARPREAVRDSVVVSATQTASPAVTGAESSGTPAAPSASRDVIPAALEAKRLSQAALEEGRAAQAIEAGERAIALDPTDAESWLILGAAYDQRGTHADAKQCFVNCVRLATHGPRGECAALLR